MRDQSSRLPTCGFGLAPKTLTSVGGASPEGIGRGFKSRPRTKTQKETGGEENPGVIAPSSELAASMDGVTINRPSPRLPPSQKKKKKHQERQPKLSIVFQKAEEKFNFTLLTFVDSYS